MAGSVNIICIFKTYRLYITQENIRQDIQNGTLEHKQPFSFSDAQTIH